MAKTIFTGAHQTLVNALKAERVRAGLKQVDLANRLNKDQSWVSLVEGSQRRVDVIEFIEFSRAVGVDPVDLFRDVVGQISDQLDSQQEG